MGWDIIDYYESGKIPETAARYDDIKFSIKNSENRSQSTHTAEQQRIIQEYENAVDSDLLEFIKYAREHKNDNKTSITLSEVSSRAAKDIKNLTGIDVDGFEHNMRANTVRHIDSGHGINGTTDKSMSDDRDIARINYVLENYDNVDLISSISQEFIDKNQNKAPMVRYSKRINGNYYVVEAVPDTRAHKLQIVSAYKNKAAEQQALIMRDNSPQLHARDVDADTTFNSATIPQNRNGVNSNINENIKNDTNFEGVTNNGEGQRNVYTDRGGERADREGTAVEALGVGERAGKNQTGREAAASRRVYVETVRKSGQAKRQVISGIRAEVVVEEAYNDDMRALARRAVSRGAKRVVFYVGDAQVWMHGKLKRVNGFKLNDNTIAVRYDSTKYTPEQIINHELAHMRAGSAKYDRAANIIRNSLSVAEQMRIVNELYRDYHEMADGNEDYIFEEFVCDVLSGMSEYSERFSDVADGFWNETNEAAENAYSAADYTESADAGGERYSAKSSINQDDVQILQSIGRKSVNMFTVEDREKTTALAEKYYREMGVESPFFRAWFGDWRENDNTPIHIVTEKGAVRGVTQNADTGWNIQVSGKVFNESRHAGKNNVSAMPYLDYINSIVENAVLLDSYSMGKTKSPNSVMMHSFYALADRGNGVDLLKLYVEEMYDPNTNGTNKRSYQLQNIYKTPLRSSGFSNMSLAPSSQRSTYTISDLFGLVKSIDKNFKPQSVQLSMMGDTKLKEAVPHPHKGRQKTDTLGRGTGTASDNINISKTKDNVNSNISEDIKNDTKLI